MGSLKRITLHWTGGLNEPNATEKAHYHFLIKGDGTIVKGNHEPEDNLDCKVSGTYAAHTGGGNTGNIGVALCGMWSNQYPIHRIQIEACCKFVASLCDKYGILVNENNVLTHAEFGLTHPKTTSAGKIDIDKLPCVPIYGVKECGKWIRNKVRWYKEKFYS